MDIEKKNKLEAKLREMLEESNQPKIPQKSVLKKQTGAGSVIRRRKGEQDKRISL